MYPDKAEIAINTIVDKLKDLDFDLVLGPAMGGIIVSYELARQMGGKLVYFLKEKMEK